MKLKFDFVTNSSSTSFCAWGIQIHDNFNNLSESMKKKIYDKYTEWYKRNSTEPASYEDFVKDPRSYEWVEYLSEVLGDVDLSCRRCYDAGVIFIGLNPNHASDDKTFGEAKDETKQKLERLGFNINNFGFILESWYS